jgi:predicted DNA-binding transcriptional regulator YafY
MKLFEIVKGLILEIASVDSVVDAIKNKDKVIIYYDGDEPGGKGLREIEPVCFGYSKADNPVLRAWDKEGASHTAYKGEQPLPGWRLFRLDKITSFRKTGEKFNTPKPGYNPDGDKTMSRVVINAKFDATTPQVDTDTIIDRTIDTLIGEFRSRFGDNFEMDKAAEAYKRIYAAIEQGQNKRLTDIEKSQLRPIISRKIQDKTRR